MGVQGLWQLLQSTGKPVSLQSLEGKILAIDVSIWLHQAVKGMRDKDGNPMPNVHLQIIFSRLCKLLYYRIKPVFVFDGGIPELKKQTLVARRERKEFAEKESSRTNRRMLENMMRKHAVKEVLGEDVPSSSGNKRRKPESQDVFDLPPLPENFKKEQEDLQSDPWVNTMQQQSMYLNDLQDPNEIDIDSEGFKQLPSEIQHEILMEMKERRKQNSWSKMHELPEEIDDFSSFQMAKLLKKSRLGSRLDEVRKDMNKTAVSDITANLNEDFYTDTVIQTSRVVSEDASHFILIKGLSKKRREEELAKAAAIMVPEEEIKEEEEVNEDDELIIDSDEERRKRDEITWIASSKQVASNEMAPKPKTNQPEKITMIDNNDISPESYKASSKNSPGDRETTPDKSQLGCKDKHSSDQEKKDDEVIVIDNDSQKTSNSSNLEVTDAVRSAVVTVSDEENTSVVQSNGKNHQNLPDEHNKFTSVKAVPCSSIDTDNKLHSSSDHLSTLAREVHECDDENSEDEGFIEVTIDPKTISEADELFPASVFLSEMGDKPASTEKSVKFVDGEKLVQTVDKEKEIQSNQLKDQFLRSNEFENEVNMTEQRAEFEEENPRETTTEDLDFDRSLQNLTESDLVGYQEDLELESRSLQQEKGKQDRLATTITDQMYAEAQELLRLFGVPYLVSPMEAEAQCAYLDLTEQCQGSITDDSDIWLFGGKRVYKNFFNQDKHVEFFRETNVTAQLGLTRDQLINIALLCGSDYTMGIPNVGPVTALEIMAEFHGPESSGLVALKSWWDKAQNESKTFGESKLRTKLRKLDIKAGFPSPAVIKAYIDPVVDKSKDTFSWGSPDLDLLRTIAKEKFGWRKERTDEVLLPVLKQINSKQTQGKIDSFFQPENFLEPSKVKSARLKQALTKLSAGPETSPEKGNKNKVEKAKETMMSRLPSKGKLKGRGKGSKSGTKTRGGKRSAYFTVKEEIALSESSSSEDDNNDKHPKISSVSVKGKAPMKKQKLDTSKPDTKTTEDDAETISSKLQSHFDILEKEFHSGNKKVTQSKRGRRLTKPSDLEPRSKYSSKAINSNRRLASQSEVNRSVSGRKAKTSAQSRISRMDVSESSSGED